ncbi:hypothetical protein EKI59_07640 [Corynebacterium sanguinis]|uniref:Uncharacterized protein n=3 Tax=Corynebacterium sanguinis TaxID=2594913 RepID=A0A6C1TYJ1_9CORY|nr:hypothetical protein EKI59_07640 [Corynebacterium sanguinis]
MTDLLSSTTSSDGSSDGSSGCSDGSSDGGMDDLELLSSLESSFMAGSSLNVEAVGLLGLPSLGLAGLLAALGSEVGSAIGADGGFQFGSVDGGSSKGLTVESAVTGSASNLFSDVPVAEDWNVIGN